MFEALKRRFHDMKTVGTLCSSAEKHAQIKGQKEPGVEHFVLAAFDLPDGTAKRAFQSLGATPVRFEHAIKQQYQDALSNLGIDFSSTPIFNQTPSITSTAKIYRAKPSGQELMKNLASQKSFSPEEPLLGAHVLLAAVDAEYGIVIRALQVLDISAGSLAAAAKDEIEAFCNT